MFTADDALKLENGNLDPREAAKMLQMAINDGAAWSFQGSYGRSMMSAIEAGQCMLGLKPSFDAYKNRIPARGEIVEGTKGTRQYVVERMGEEWAVMLEEVAA